MRMLLVLAVLLAGCVRRVGIEPTMQAFANCYISAATRLARTSSDSTDLVGRAAVVACASLGIVAYRDQVTARGSAMTPDAFRNLAVEFATARVVEVRAGQVDGAASVTPAFGTPEHGLTAPGKSGGLKSLDVE